MNHERARTRKRFGQHFLSDDTVLQSIIDAIAPLESDTFVEIGPGEGVLTRPLLASGAHCDAIEIDRDLVARLQQWDEPHFRVHEGDALSMDFDQCAREHPYRLVGNLPYNISTPLLFHCFEHIANIRDMHFLLQKEVVDRLVAPVGSSAYGRLSVMTQYYTEASDLLAVPPSAFTPPPKVDSSFVRLIPHAGQAPSVDVAQLSAVVKMAFQHRRKTIYNNLKSCCDRDDLLSLGIDPRLRPQNITVADYIALSQYLLEHQVD